VPDLADPALPTLEAALAVVDREAAAGAHDGRLTDAAVAALRGAGLFKLFLPADLGGAERSLPDAVRLMARVAAADGAAGWAVMIGAGPGWFAGQMAPQLAHEVFGPPDSVVAGSGLPGTAVPTDGGWRVDGRWRWCSGAPWATWFTFGAAPADGPALVVAVPAADVVLHPDTWDVHGLRATASWDAELRGVVVPAARVFVVEPAGPQRPEPIFRVPFVAFAEASMAAVSLGVARRILDDFADLARTKVPTFGTAVLADDPVVQDRLARVEAAARAGARSFEAAVATVWAAVAEHAAPGDGDLLDLRLAACHAVAVGAEVAAAVRPWAGMTVVERASRLGRALADAEALTQNAIVGAARFAEAGAALLGRP
jgi:alkylation response protein AidB-like acyl-CoA dehydrogenase